MQLTQLSHARKVEKIHHPEVSSDLTASLWQRGSPTRAICDIGIAVKLEQADDAFAHDAAADGSEMDPFFHHLSFFENVVPERRGLIELLTEVLQFFEVLAGKRRNVHVFGDSLSGWELPSHMTEQVALGQRSRRFGRRSECRDRRKRQVEQRCGDFRVDLFVGSHIAVPEIEESLPTDEASLRPKAAAQVV